MYPNLFPTLFFLIIISILIRLPTCLCVDNDQYVTCGELFSCANIQDIGYPFWGGSRPPFCGHSGFELYNCQSDVPLITIQSRPYRVLGLDNTTQSLTVARDDLWNQTCPEYLYNTTLDPTLFTLRSSDQNITLHYGCTLSSQIQPLPNQFDCNVNRSTSVTFFTLTSTIDIGNNLVTCNSSVSVPINQTSAQALSNPTTAPIDVLRAALASGFGLQWAANDTTCDRCLGSGGRCGSNSTSFACYCADQPYSFTCNNTGAGSTAGQNHGLRLAIGLSVSGAGIVMLLFVIICSHRRQWLSFKALFFWKKGEMNNQNVEAFIRNYGSLTPKRYNYLDIKKITNSFADKLGEGGYGDVFKGKLSDGHLVAVKVLRETKGNGEDFINEVASISRTSHVNIVTLLGFCVEGNKRALVYEFMPNRSLDKFICNDGSSNTSCRLDLKTLYQIAVGSARGLEYLHQGCNTRIVHFDINPENILLDEDFCPKIADFGLAKLCQRKKSVVSMLGARGTPGYIAPEVFCRNFGEVSHKSDVYSYGMMVINIVGARENIEDASACTSEIYFPDWIYKFLELGKALTVLQGVTTEEEEETARKMILVSLWCIQTNPSDRPSMSKVVEMLEGSFESLTIPPKPFLFSPMIPTRDSSSSLSESSEIVITQ